MTGRRGPALVVLFCSVLWGIWWLPIGILGDAGLSGPWIALAIGASAFPVALAWTVFRPGAVSGRAVVGALLFGGAVTLYAMAASYTEFLRAMLIFYLAPIWTTLIEFVFLGRRWQVRSLLAIGLSLAGVVLITRGEVGFDGLGALGDWLALVSGLTWSAGVAMIFASSRAQPSTVLLLTTLGGIATALVVAWAGGSALGPAPDAGSLLDTAPVVAPFTIAYAGMLLAGTLWGAFHLAPAAMMYLLSVEVVVGTVTSAIFLNDPFGTWEIGGAACILGAVLVEVILTPPTPKPGPAGR